MKKLILVICFLLSFSANAMISRLSKGVTYCAVETGANYKIDWKANTIVLTFAGSDEYKIVKESKTGDGQGIVLTARMPYWNDYLEIKIISTPHGDFSRVWLNDEKVYSYHAARLSCWDEV